jgi:ABC-2 type transport system permease protein
MTALAKLTVLEARLVLREPSSIFGFVFPTILLTILGSVPYLRAPIPDFGGLRVIDIYLPILCGLALATLALNTLPGFLATYRERGVLRRLSTTPLHPVRLLTAQLVVNLVAAVLSIGLLVAVANVALHVAIPKQFLGFLITLVFLAASLFTIGLLIAATAPNGRGANGIGSLLIWPMMFTAGMWTPGFTPEIIRRMGEFTPLGAGVRALQRTWAGSWPQPQHLLVMAGCVVIFGLFATKAFRWE